MIKHLTSLVLAVTCALTARAADIMRVRFFHFTETQLFKFLPAEAR